MLASTTNTRINRVHSMTRRQNTGSGKFKEPKKQILFKEFYESHKEMAYRFIRAKRFPENNVQDILSRCFELAWDRFDEYLLTDKQDYWFFNIVRNKVKYEMRRDQKSRVIRFPSHQALLHDVKNPGPAEQTIKKERKSYLKNIIHQLPEQYQTVVKLRLEGYSYSEISGMLAISVKSAQHRMKRAMPKMESALRQFAQDFFLDG